MAVCLRLLSVDCLNGNGLHLGLKAMPFKHRQLTGGCVDYRRRL